MISLSVCIWKLAGNLITKLSLVLGAHKVLNSHKSLESIYLNPQNKESHLIFFSFQAERDSLAEARRELERKLETKELELHEKEEELFLQLEKVVRLEEDCEKVGFDFLIYRQ